MRAKTYKIEAVLGDHVTIILKDGKENAGELSIHWANDLIELEVVRVDEAVTGEVQVIVH